MPTPKPTSAPAQRKQVPEHVKFNDPGMFEAARLRSLGRKDGHHALPKQDEDGVWSSPHTHKEANAYNEFCISEWSGLQARHEVKHKEIARLCQEIPRLFEQLDTHRQNAPPPADLTERLKGEEGLSENIIRRRREREYQKYHIAYFSKARQLEAAIEESYRKLSEMQSVIHAAEKTTRMLCERSSGHVMQRVAIYWASCLKTHPKFKTIPPEPEITLSSTAEAEYFAQNKHIQEDIKRVSALRQRIQNDGMAVNNYRTGGTVCF